MACILLWSSAVRVHDSQTYRNMNVTKERISRILELWEILLSIQTGFQPCQCCCCLCYPGEYLRLGSLISHNVIYIVAPTEPGFWAASLTTTKSSWWELDFVVGREVAQNQSSVKATRSEYWRTLMLREPWWRSFVRTLMISHHDCQSDFLVYTSTPHPPKKLYSLYT